MIESSNNRQIRYLQRLQESSRFRKKERAFLAEGWKMIAEALSRGLVKKIYVDEEQKEEWEKRFGGESLSCEFVKKNVFARICDTISPQGAVAVAEMPSYELEDYLSGDRRRFLCLEDIRDPGNLGTMIRTAEGAGMTGVIMSRGTADLFNPKASRSTMGSLFRVPFFYTEDFVGTMHLLCSRGIVLYAAHLQGSTPYREVSYGESLGILIGNEANGLSEQAAQAADFRVRIPMAGQLESLNAAISAAILMYETISGGR